MRDSTKTPLDVLNEIMPCFNAFKEKIKDYPKGFRLFWDEEHGFFIEGDFDVIEQVLADQSLSR